MTGIPYPADLEDWKLAIVRGAMLHAEVVPGIINSAFAERIRALSVVQADRAGVDQALNALRNDLLRAIDHGHASAAELAGEWWA